MRRTLTCPRCGIEFEANHSRTIYCPDCRYAARLEKRRELYQQNRGEAKPKDDDGIHFCDTPERIATCLNCPLPPEKCHGNICKRLEVVPGHTYQRRMMKHGKRSEG